jgi:hypothetical protein
VESWEDTYGERSTRRKGANATNASFSATRDGDLRIAVAEDPAFVPELQTLQARAERI